MPAEIVAGRLVDEELERELVAAVRAAIQQPTPRERATVVIASTLGHLAGMDGIEDTEKTLTKLYGKWAKAIADALGDAGLLGA